jgi:cysteinyl-tRNA synthetase
MASMGHQAVKYWMHNNMITINGQKMGKSLGNFITLEQFFTGQHEKLAKAYSPMTIRFFILSAHYRGTVDFSNEALEAAEKGLEKLMNAISDLERVQASDKCDAETEKVVKSLRQKCYDAMNDDFATPQVISHLFEACTVVNKLIDHKATICADCLKELKETMHLFAFDILGLSMLNAQCSMLNGANEAREEAFGKVVDMVLELRAKARAEKDWATCDKIRDELKEAGFEVKDTKDGVTWKLNK